MAETDSSSVPKPHVYDLLGRLNAAFARVHRNTQLLSDTGIFDPPTIERIRDLTEALRADANCSLLETLQGIEQRDKERFATRE